MMGGGKEQKQSLADIIMEKINQKGQQNRMQEEGGNNNDNDADDDGYTNIPEKVAEVYTDIGKILSRYAAGKLPKAFKVIFHLLPIGKKYCI